MGLSCRYAFLLARLSGREVTIWFEFLVALLLSPNAKSELKRFNPQMEIAQVRMAVLFVQASEQRGT